MVSNISVQTFSLICVLVFWSPTTKVQASKNNFTNIPQNSYYVQKHSDKELSSTSDEIIKKTPLTGARIVADKLVNDIFVYAPKGMKGSRNSNFYEFLSLGLVPNIVGSGMLIALFNAVNKNFRDPDRAFAGIPGRKMAFGVVFYAIGKWLGSKLINKGVEMKTGVDLEMPYRKVVTELPEHPGDKDLTAVEYHRVFESADFPRWDLINKAGEKQGNRYIWYDKIAKKMGFKEPLNSPDQTVQGKVKEVIIKSSAAKSISSFIWAGLGVALAVQAPFENKIVMPEYAKRSEKLMVFARNCAVTLKESFMDLYNGNNFKFTRGAKIVGRTLIFGALASTILGVMNATRGFKVAKNQPDTQIDINKGYEVH